jgi:hypothetical protein
MKKIFFVVILFFVAFVSCKTSKVVSSGYQPPVAGTTAVPDSVKVGEALQEVVTQNPIVMRTEGFTYYNAADLEGGYFDYYVIIGSFVNPNNATNLSELLILKGFDPTILNSETGKYRVAVKGTNDKKEANDLVYRIRSISPEYSDVWLLKRK